jgi:hypothetical protein
VGSGFEMVARAKAVRKQASYTADDLWEMASRPEYEDKLLELIEGELIVMMLQVRMADSNFRTRRCWRRTLALLLRAV